MSATAIDVDTALLRAWPLPQPGTDADKEDRGHVLVIAGSREMPGALILAANATLNAGAGKLSVATASGVARLVATALPEARVIDLSETRAGGIGSKSLERIRAVSKAATALLIGPGMQDEPAGRRVAAALVARQTQAPLVLDAAAMGIVRGPKPLIRRFLKATVMTPHCGELAHLTGAGKAEIQRNPARAAVSAAHQWNAVVVLKGPTTFIAAPSGSLWRHTGGNSGLAISGSGDVLAGIITGLAARGAPTEQAAVWGVALHARAGDLLAQLSGPLGYLARDLSAQVPGLMGALAIGSFQR